MVCVCGRHKTEVNAMASHVGSMPATRKMSLIYAVDILMKSCRFCS